MLLLRTAANKQSDEMNRLAPTYFTRRFKSAETVAQFKKKVLRSAYTILEATASQI